MQYKPIETERLILKPASEEDAGFYFELMNSPKWLKFIGDRNVKNIEDAKKIIQDKMISQFDRLGFGNYVVIVKESNQKVGSCGLYDRDGLEGIDIGFAFLPEFIGKGYGYEAANTLKNKAFDTFNLEEICAITMPTNIPSQKLLEKIGLTFSKMVKVGNDPEEMMYYTLKNLKNN